VELIAGAWKRVFERKGAAAKRYIEGLHSTGQKGLTALRAASSKRLSTV
jgi:hypothetical protein